MKHVLATVGVVLALGNAYASVIGIDLTSLPTSGPTGNKLAGVIGQSSDVAWNPISQTNLYPFLVTDEDVGTGASFEVLGPCLFGKTTGTTTSFFNTYGYLEGSADAVQESSFAIHGIVSSSVNVYCYATWDWIEAGSRFRVSGDDGVSWTDWKLSDGDPSDDDAAFLDGSSYVAFTNVTIGASQTLLGEWQSAIEGESVAHRGIFNAIQIEGTFDSPAAVSFNESSFSANSAKTLNEYSGTIAGTASGVGLSYALLTDNTWLSVAADGTLSGMPAQSDVGVSTFSVQVTDELGSTDTATLTIEVMDAPAVAWSYTFTSTADSDAAGSRRYTAFSTSNFAETILAINCNKSTANNTGPGFFYMPTGLTWLPNKIYTINFDVGDRSDSTDGATVEYGLFDGIPEDDDGTGDYTSKTTQGTESYWAASSQKSLGTEGQITIVHIGANAISSVETLSGSTASDVAFTFVTPSDVSTLGEMVFFVRCGESDDGVDPDGLRAHVNNFQIMIESVPDPDKGSLEITTTAEGLLSVNVTGLSAEGHVINKLQFRESLMTGDWIDVSSVQGTSSTNWIIDPPSDSIFYRIESSY